MVLVLGVCLGASGASTATPEVTSQPAVVLLIKDTDPWNTPSNEEALRTLDIPYEVIKSTQLGEGALDLYSIVLIASDQPTETYERLIRYREKLAAYVDQGGILIVHAADRGRSVSHWDQSFLPGGVHHENEYLDDLTIRNLLHPLITGSPLGVAIYDTALNEWGHSSHGYFTNLHPEVDIIIVTKDGKPTYIKYCFGKGIVFATMQTIEWGWKKNGGWKALLLNELNYVLSPVCELEGEWEAIPAPFSTSTALGVLAQKSQIKQVTGKKQEKLEWEAKVKAINRMLQKKDLDETLRKELKILLKKIKKAEEATKKTEEAKEKVEEAREKGKEALKKAEEALKKAEEALKKAEKEFKEVAVKIGKTLLKQLLKVFKAGRYANIILTIAFEAGKVGNAIGQWMAATITKAMRDDAIKWINTIKKPIRAFPSLIDWHVIIVDSTCKPLSASYTFEATTEKVGYKTEAGSNIKKSGSTKKDGYDNEGNKEQMRRVIPKGIAKSSVKVWTGFWPFRKFKTVTNVIYAINGPIVIGGVCVKNSLIKYQITVKITVK